MRKNPLVNDQYYHIFNRSIAGYLIFNSKSDFSRMIAMFNFYRFKELPCSFSKFEALKPSNQKELLNELNKSNSQLVEILAYSLMPTHFHLILKQKSNDGITKYMTKILDSYSKHFNLEHGRKGPLWEGYFKSVLIESDEQMLHLTRYIHLNATTAGLVENPNEWLYSSYREYLRKTSTSLCQFDQVMDIKPKKYEKFVLDRISYQRDLAIIKHLMFDSYYG